jgi:hypothetical protein
MELIINGLYKHYKGNNYKVLHVAKHSETLEELVVYQALYGEHGVWVRPLDMFLESIEKDNKVIKRFAYVGADNTARVHITLPADVKDFIYENDIDLPRLIKEAFPQITVDLEAADSGSKDLGVVILCAGVSVALVVIAINRLVETFIRRPKYVEVTELTEDGNILTTHTELLQPTQSKRDLSIGFELSTQNIKLNFTDKSE